MRRGLLAGRFEAALQRLWWRPQPHRVSALLRPLAALYGWLARRAARGARAQPLPVPLLVVGNITVGGAGKTPTVIALVDALRAAGRRPGVISRGYGRLSADVRQVAPGDSALLVGDEPLLIHLRTGVPVWVGRDRASAARALCAEHPEVDVLLSDDGLQHAPLHRDAELLVFDDRGVGNGLLLPAGPLRQALPGTLRPWQRVLYTGGKVSTPLPGAAARPSLRLAWPLAAWRSGRADQAQPLSTLTGRTVLAAAGLAAPEKFFSMLEAAGLSLQRLPLPDHHDYAATPWPATTSEVVVTEKDAVKLAALPAADQRVWVVPLDFEIPPALVDDLISLLTRRPPAL